MSVYTRIDYTIVRYSYSVFLIPVLTRYDQYRLNVFVVFSQSVMPVLFYMRISGRLKHPNLKGRICETLIHLIQTQ